MINSATELLLKGENLDSSTVKEVFDEILSGLADSVQASAFITAFKMKNYTIDEITAAIVSANDSVKNSFSISDYENSITSVVLDDDNNWLDFSLATDLISAAMGLRVFKHSLSNPLKNQKSFEILKFFGLNIPFSTEISDDIIETDFVYGYLPNEVPFLKYTNDIFRKLKFDNIFNLIYKMLNPYNAKNIMIAANKDFEDKLAKICLELKYSNSLVTYAKSNVPFVSIEGDTFISEAWKNKIFTYVLNPVLLDFNEDKDDKLKLENNEHNFETLMAVFENKEKDTYYSAIIMNSALALYISKKADSIIDGINLARKAIDSGLVLDKINQIKKAYS